MIEAVPDFSEEEVQNMLDNLDAFSDDEVVEINRIVDELAARQANQAAYDDLIEFCKRMQPDYIVGKQVGQGAYATVRLAIHKASGKKLAIKIYEKSRLVDPGRYLVLPR